MADCHGSATPMARLAAVTPTLGCGRSPGAHLPLVRALTIEAHAPPQGDEPDTLPPTMAPHPSE
jgi:hypothetical protein